MRWKDRPIIAVGVLLIVVGGLAIATLLASPVASPTPGGRSAQQSALPPGLAKLDAPSRALGLQLEPGEVVTATLGAGTDQRSAAIARRARALGLEASTLGDRPQVAVTGPLESVLSVAALAAVSGGYLTEDTRALRPMAEPLAPEHALPVAGSPYRDEPLLVDAGQVPLPPAQRTALLAQLADMVVTIDGRPYAELWIEGGCGDAANCYITLEGASLAGSSQRDRWPLQTSARTGWFGIVDPLNPPAFEAMPRWLGREGERIARSDAGTLDRIRAFDRIVGFAWDPRAPGRIEVRYAGSCATGRDLVASLTAGPIADMGCEQTLAVSVDIGERRVVAVR